MVIPFPTQTKGCFFTGASTTSALNVLYTCKLFTEDEHHGKYEDREVKRWFSTKTTNKERGFFEDLRI